MDLKSETSSNVRCYRPVTCKPRPTDAVVLNEPERTWLPKIPDSAVG
jgi:hypothetical protein